MGEDFLSKEDFLRGFLYFRRVYIPSSEVARRRLDEGYDEGRNKTKKKKKKKRISAKMEKTIDSVAEFIFHGSLHFMISFDVWTVFQVFFRLSNFFSLSFFFFLANLLCRQKNVEKIVKLNSNCDLLYLFILNSGKKNFVFFLCIFGTKNSTQGN